MIDFEQRAADFFAMLAPLSDEDAFELRGEYTQIYYEPGTIVNVAGQNFIVLESFENGTTAILQKDYIRGNRTFGASADWRESSVREYLNTDYYRHIADEIGAENIVRFKRNLIALDGCQQYGTCEDDISVLSLDEYRMYNHIIKQHRIDKWSWMLTPYGEAYSRSVCCVVAGGSVNWDGYGNGFVVRPFLIVNSAVLSV